MKSRVQRESRKAESEKKEEMRSGTDTEDPEATMWGQKQEERGRETG